MKHSSVLSILALVASLAAATDGGAATSRSYTTASTLLRLDGAMAERPKSVTVTETATATGTASTAVVQFPPAQGGALTQWVTGVLRGSTMTHGLEILTLTSDMKLSQVESLSRVSFNELDLPNLDGASTVPIAWTIHLPPASSTIKAGDGSSVSSVAAKTLLANDFRVAIDGVADTQYVRKVGGVSVKIATTYTMQSGTRLSASTTMVPKTTQTVSPLPLTVASGHATAFQQWLASRAAKTVTVSYLSSTLTDVICTLTYANVVPGSITTESGTTNVVVQTQPSNVQISCP